MGNCIISKSGGNSITKTLLWTNPSPTSDLGNDTDITLTKEYKYFLVEYKFKKDSSIINTSIVTASYNGGGNKRVSGGFGSVITSMGTDYKYIRTISFASNATVLNIGACQGQGSTQNSYAIATRIWGLENIEMPD